jgi:hypothetical protein
MAEKEPFRIGGQKASARAWNCSASDGLEGIAKLFDLRVSGIETR